MFTKYQVAMVAIYAATSVATIILYKNHLKRMEKKAR